MRKQKPDQQQNYVDSDLLQRTIQQLLEQISKRDQKITRINAESAAALRAAVEREQAMLVEKAEQEAILLHTRTQVAEYEAILLHTRTQLAERDAQINEIVTSNTWRVALFFQRVRSFLVPLNSRRARILQRGLEVISLPFKKVKGK